MDIYKIKIYFLLICWSFSCNVTLFSQNLKSDIKKMNVALLSKNKWHIITENNISTPSEVIESVQFDMKKFGDNYKVTEKKSELIVNSKLIIALNHTQKHIYVSERGDIFSGGNDIVEVNKMLDLEFDTLMKLYQKVEFTKKSKTQSCYTFTFKNIEYDKAEIIFDSQSYLIIETRFWMKEKIQIANYKEKQTLIISKRYKLYDFNPLFDASYFSGKDLVLTDSKGKMKPTQKYVSYKLYNFNDNSYAQ